MKAVNREFILLCKQLSLFGGKEVAIDGSFFSANASKGSIYTEEKLEKQIKYLDKKLRIIRRLFQSKMLLMTKKAKEVYPRTSI
uniref:Uncharacterized protein n=1 Tax=Candidatus Kentrum sp. LPFa TaxID=2126335 RepID=A0A450XEG1_9GAMM|nr:MAG: hypothetical protein BECKLPF1236A_GA0070988_105961 [Candidatus Kentron sp. LPFa]